MDGHLILGDFAKHLIAFGLGILGAADGFLSHLLDPLVQFFAEGSPQCRHGAFKP